jgi:hypothetical protein
VFTCPDEYEEYYCRSRFLVSFIVIDSSHVAVTVKLRYVEEHSSARYVFRQTMGSLQLCINKHLTYPVSGILGFSHTYLRWEPGEPGEPADHARRSSNPRNTYVSLPGCVYRPTTLVRNRIPIGRWINLFVTFPFPTSGGGTITAFQV